MLVSDERKEKLQNFASSLGLEFKNYELLNRAFCHTSYIYELGFENKTESYERLEFLGDAVLKLAVSDILYNEYQDKNEGQLSAQRAIVVADKTIAVFAKQIGMSDLLLLGKCEKTGGKGHDTILACAFEAFLGAIYLEYKNEGFIKAKNFLTEKFKDQILNVNFSNPKAELQEFTQKINHNLPEYVVLNETGPAHDKTFEVAVYYENKYITKGVAKTKKEAEMIAAKFALVCLKEKYGDFYE